MGIDPGYARLGYGFVAGGGVAELSPLNFGCIETGKAPFDRRLLILYNSLVEVINSSPRPDYIAIERLFFSKNTKTAALVYQTRGMLFLLAAQNNIKILEPHPNEIKKIICGDIHADKHSIQAGVTAMLNLSETPKPDDTADALAAAVWGIKSYESGEHGAE